MAGELGRLEPTDWKHVEKYPFSAVIEEPHSPITIPTGSFDRALSLPVYWREWDQGREGACVGFGTSMMMALTNRKQDPLHRQYRYNPMWLYREAQKVDEWPGENYSGTSVRAACDVLRNIGHVRVLRGKDQPVSLSEGIDTNRWATGIDEIRAAIYSGLAVSIGINWYRDFDTPHTRNGELFIGQDNWLQTGIRGGHCVCIYRMSDRRNAFRILNSWGASYPPVWFPYDVIKALLMQDGEAAVITDR